MSQPIYLLILFVFMINASLNGDQQEGFTVDLREPSYSEGVLSTDKGGVISTPQMRIQGREIYFFRKKGEEKRIIASGDLIIEHGCTLFVGDRIEYNLDTGVGTLYNGRSAVEPWYFGGKCIHLHPSGDYSIDEAYLTTSESLNPSWRIKASELTLEQRHLVIANNTTFLFGEVPLLWLPTFYTDLDTIYDAPIRFTARLGGRQGPRIGVIYDLFSWETWKTFLRVEYNLSRGFGAGLESTYHSLDHRTYLHGINYYARDFELSEPHRRNRYRFQGLFEHIFSNDATTIDISYDKTSDKDMPSDYDDRGIVIETVERSQLHLRHQDPLWIANFLTRVRLNTFQTVKQELPTLDVHLIPLTLGETGIIMDNHIKASYLDFVYQRNEMFVSDYTSTRVELNHLFYRSFQTNGTNLIPEAGIVAIYYGNSDDKDEEWTTLGLFGCEINKSWHRYFGSYKHILEPYIDYHYFTSPTVSPNDHYIFDITDGWARLNQFKVGMRHHLFRCEDCSTLSRDVYLDLYTYAFFNTPTIPKTWPKVYLDCEVYTTPRLRHQISFGWDLDFSLIDHFNVRTEYTLNGDTAVAVEYRHRSPYAWRKVDYSNFILDSFHTIEQMRVRQLSDRRDTMILHLFHRFHPDWAIEMKSRYGWNREIERNYTELECNLIGIIRSTWHLTFSYQYREDDRRFAISFNVGLDRPTSPSCAPLPLPL